jgi:hypothetical protein
VTRNSRNIALNLNISLKVHYNLENALQRTQCQLRMLILGPTVSLAARTDKGYEALVGRMKVNTDITFSVMQCRITVDGRRCSVSCLRVHVALYNATESIIPYHY